MIKKLLIANRGEIACRIMRAAQALNISTVAIYSDADANAMHVAMADEAIHIGPAPSAQSYLVVENILAAIELSGADAVHPGYGFLSENAKFVEQLQSRGIIFVGPTVEAIDLMGDKITAKKLAEKAGVNSVPAHLEAVSDPDIAVRIANDIGYPVMLKASSGGGGKGMRLAWNDDEAREGLASAMSEGKRSFGDDRVFLEKFIQSPRHIEIQILADGHGNIVYLGERECSIQRRHQKVIEECPSPFVTPQLRAAMGQQALELARAVNYVSAGTVEFIVDAQGNFFFLEMNTRLQVEHPVSEAVTGVDLVQWMLRIANGDALDFAQDDVTYNGWAIEARIYAEDSKRGFVPSTGVLSRFSPPDDVDLRLDSGIMAGHEVTPYYDPMLAKLIVHDETRDAAIAKMVRALSGFHIAGVESNLGILEHIIRDRDFASGDFSTAFIETHYGDEFSIDDTEMLDHTIMAVLGLHSWLGIHPPNGDWEFSVFCGDDFANSIDVQIITYARDHALYAIGAQQFEITCGGDACGMPVRYILNAEQYDTHLQRHELGMIVTTHAMRTTCTIIPSRIAGYLAHMPVKQGQNSANLLIAPMPGQILRISASVGDKISAGQELCVLEAMKMENILRAPVDVVIDGIDAKVGDMVQVDQVLMSFAQ